MKKIFVLGMMVFLGNLSFAEGSRPNLFSGIFNIVPFPVALQAGASYERIISRSFSLSARLYYEYLFGNEAAGLGLTWQGLASEIGSKYIFWHFSYLDFASGLFLSPSVGLGIYETSEGKRHARDASFWQSKEAWIPFNLTLGYLHRFTNRLYLNGGMRFNPIIIMLPFQPSNASLVFWTLIPRLELSIGCSF